MSHFVRKSDSNRIKVWEWLEAYHGRGIGKQQWVASGWRLRDATIKLQRRRQSGFRDGAIVLTSYESTTEVRDDVPGSERFAVDARTANSADPGTRHAVHTVLAQVATLPLRPSTASQPATRSGERARRQPRTRRAPSALRQTVNYYKSVKTWTLAIELRAHSRDTIRNLWSLNPNRSSWVVAQRPDRQELNAFIVFFFRRVLTFCLLPVLEHPFAVCTVLATADATMLRTGAGSRRDIEDVEVELQIEFVGNHVAHTNKMRITVQSDVESFVALYAQCSKCARKSRSISNNY